MLKGGRNKKRKFQLIDVNWGSRDVRESMRIDCIVEDESSPPLLTDEQEETLASKASPPSLVGPEESPPLLTEAENSSPSIEVAESSPPSLSGELISKGQCAIVKRSCTKHNVDAKMTKMKRKVWTKIPKTGLYGYRTRTAVLWECPTKYNPANLLPEQSKIQGDTGDYQAANFREGNPED